MHLILKSRCFTFVHKERKSWCVSTSSNATGVFQRCYHSSENYIHLMQRGPCERQARHLQNTMQRPGRHFNLGSPTSR